MSKYPDPFENRRLPCYGWDGEIDSTPMLSTVGIKVIKRDPNDFLFYVVEFPKRWRFRETTVNYWTELVNEVGRPVARIFYKNEPGERKAYIKLA